MWIVGLFRKKQPAKPEIKKPEIIKCCLSCKFFERRTDGVYQCSRGVIDHTDPYHENKDKFSCSHWQHKSN